jgi:hypothetical protein
MPNNRKMMLAFGHVSCTLCHRPAHNCSLQHLYKHLRGRLYSVSGLPRPVAIPTCISSVNNDCYPLVEAVLDYPRLQPYVHDCVVTVLRGRRQITFAIFFKHHVRLPRNPYVSRGRPSLINGDLVVMRKGTRAPYVNFRGRDCVISDWVVRE